MPPQLLLVNPYRTLQGRCAILVHGGLTSGLAAWLSGNSHSTRPRPPLKKAKETLRHRTSSLSRRRTAVTVNSANGDKEAFSKALSGLANADGGVLVFGVKT